MFSFAVGVIYPLSIPLENQAGNLHMQEIDGGLSICGKACSWGGLFKSVGLLKINLNF